MLKVNNWCRLGSVMAFAIISATSAVAENNATLPVDAVPPIDGGKLISIFDNIPKKTYPEPSIELLNRYDWRLIETQDKDGRTLLNEVVPLNLNIRPSMLVFNIECQRYVISFDGGNAGDFPYFLSSVGDKSICQSDMPHPYIKQDLNTTFNIGYRYLPGNIRMGFAWLNDEDKSVVMLPDMADLPQEARLAIHINDFIFPENSHLIWQGTLKPIESTSSSTTPISKDLLESKRWRLKQSSDANGQPIKAFGYANIPILASFYTRMPNDPLEASYSIASFSSECNGIGGPYVLTPANTLLIGSGPQTMRGCGPAKELAEDTLRQLMHDSTSQLELESLETGEYVLTQKPATGETLIWHSEPKTK